MSERVRFVLIGAGAIARSYAEAFEAHPEAELVSVVDVRVEAARAVAERAGCSVFGSFLEFLRTGPSVDAVVICTPPDSHELITTAAARAGLHVLCEKPFALTSDSARRMAVEARKAEVLLTMASKFRYVADVTRAREIVASGKIGEVVLFENVFTARVDMSQRWNSDPAVSGGGVLIDNGTHSVDLMRYFLGPLAEVHCVEGKRIQALSVEDTVRVFVRSSSGVMGSVDLSWSVNKELDWYLNIYGSRGTVQVGWKESRWKHVAGPWEVLGNGYCKTDAFRTQLGNFARAIRGREPLVITWEDAVASVDVVAAAYQSLRAAPWTGVANRPNSDMSPPPLGDTPRTMRAIHD